MAEEKIITNKVTGEKVQFLKTTKETNGEYFQFELWVSPKGFMPMRHLHNNYAEMVEVKSGVLKVEHEGEIKYLGAGEAFNIEKGRRHQWWNESDTETVNAIFTITPAHRFEVMLEQIFGICNEKGTLSFWQIMAMAKEYDMISAGPPPLVQKIMTTILAPIANLMGYRKYYSKYSQLTFIK